MIRASARLIVPTTLLMLAGCAGSAEYPSLAIRDVERVQGSASPAPDAADAIPALPPASADLTTRLAGLVETARQSHTRFQSRQAATERAVAAAGATASDSWSSAQVALSDLQTSRSGALTALAELDQLYVDERAAHPEQVSPAAATIATARDQVNGWVSAETSVISRLEARIR
ncbi:hypothetical protein [uncultured Novosphingobium sp.]|uniref:hypothetical protein n=1 Tax=uncultured Novosphingobium sp. TaxID=292277 RepID=UPI00258E6393|nr:hypothetical protein [uncultured Novosphingobium sp.]